ncbi:MAG: hypothetical protein ACYDCE_09825 [Candidatus Acidiferrales bacterium]
MLVFVAEDELSLLATIAFFFALRAGAAADDVPTPLPGVSVFLSPFELANAGAADMSAIATKATKSLLIHSSLRMFPRLCQRLNIENWRYDRGASPVEAGASCGQLVEKVHLVAISAAAGEPKFAKTQGKCGFLLAVARWNDSKQKFATSY